MLIEEARWLGAQLSALDPADIFPLLDVGSSTEWFRTREQPWIDQLIFAPARKRGSVLHLDAKADQGVDIVADLDDPAVVSELSRRGFKSIFCANLLEHVSDRKRLASSLLAIVAEGGYLFVSCPFRYPFHPDPIDTLFRPSPEELARLFPGSRLHRQAVVTDGTFLDQVRRAPLTYSRLLLRLLVPFYRPAAWRRAIGELFRYIPWISRRFEATCVVLIREAGGRP